jgi:hypothetical protein
MVATWAESTGASKVAKRAATMAESSVEHSVGLKVD